MTPRNGQQSQPLDGDGGSVGPMTKRTATADPTTVAVSQPELTGAAELAPVELPELMTSAEVATALRLSAYVVREYVRTGVLPGYRIGRELRIPRDAVARFLHSARIAR